MMPRNLNWITRKRIVLYDESYWSEQKAEPFNPWNFLSNDTFPSSDFLPITDKQLFETRSKGCSFTLLTEHKCLAEGKFCSENDKSVNERMGGFLLLFLKRVRINLVQDGSQAGKALSQRRQIFQGHKYQKEEIKINPNSFLNQTFFQWNFILLTEQCFPLQFVTNNFSGISLITVSFLLSKFTTMLLCRFSLIDL